MARKKSKRVSNQSKKRMKSKKQSRKQSRKGMSKKRKQSKKSMGKIKVVSDLLSSSYGIGALQKKEKSGKDEIDSFLKGIDTKSSGPYNLDKVFKENEKGYKGQRVNKKGFSPKKPDGKSPSKKSPKSPKKKSSKKKSKYQEFVSKKLKEYKSLDIPQPQKMKKAAEEWNKFKSL